MSKLPFYYIYGNDTDLIEKKWLPDLKGKYPNASFSWYDTSIDEISIGKVVMDFCSHNIFHEGKVIIVRNADTKPEITFELVSNLKENYVDGNAVVLVAGSLNKTTKLGKLVSKEFICQNFSLPEIKPFDMLDALNVKNSLQVLNQCRKLFDNGYKALSLYSLIYNHLVLMKKVKEREGDSFDWIAKDLKQHQFRIKKMMVANRYWQIDEIDSALRDFNRLGGLLRTWQYDENMLLQMCLISICM